MCVLTDFPYFAFISSGFSFWSMDSSPTKLVLLHKRANVHESLLEAFQNIDPDKTATFADVWSQLNRDLKKLSKHTVAICLKRYQGKLKSLTLGNYRKLESKESPVSKHKNPLVGVPEWREFCMLFSGSTKWRTDDAGLVAPHIGIVKNHEWQTTDIAVKAGTLLNKLAFLKVCIDLSLAHQRGRRQSENKTRALNLSKGPRDILVNLSSKDDAHNDLVSVNTLLFCLQVEKEDEDCLQIQQADGSFRPFSYGTSEVVVMSSGVFHRVVQPKRTRIVLVVFW